MANDVDGKTQNVIRVWNTLVSTLAAAFLGWLAVELNGLGKDVATIQEQVRGTRSDISSLKDAQRAIYPESAANAVHDRFRQRLDSHDSRIRNLEIITGTDREDLP